MILFIIYIVMPVIMLTIIKKTSKYLINCIYIEGKRHFNTLSAYHFRLLEEEDGLGVPTLLYLTRGQKQQKTRKVSFHVQNWSWFSVSYNWRWSSLQNVIDYKQGRIAVYARYRLQTTMWTCLFLQRPIDWHFFDNRLFFLRNNRSYTFSTINMTGKSEILR